MKISRFTPLATVLVTATLGLAPVGAQDGPPPPDEMPPISIENPATTPTTSGSVAANGTAQASNPTAQPPAMPGGNNPGRPPGRPDGAAFRQRMNERIKTALKASDEEWAVIQPLLEKVQEKQHEVMMRRMAGLFGGDRRGGGNRPGGPDGNNANANANRPPRPSQPELEALKNALQNDGTSTDEIKAKLEAVRAARKKANAELETASEDLRKVLTLKQEALLIMMGILQ